ncbi:MAG TPA: hypothetical protein VIV40_40495, partial [Kofleriaceae bacterium]
TSTAKHDDRAVALVVDQRECAALGLGAKYGVDLDAAANELFMRAMAERVVAEGTEKATAGAPAGELDRRDAAATRGNRQRRFTVDDFAGARYVLDVNELHPFEVTDDGDAHRQPIPRDARRDCGATA